MKNSTYILLFLLLSFSQCSIRQSDKETIEKSDSISKEKIENSAQELLSRVDSFNFLLSFFPIDTFPANRELISIDAYFKKMPDEYCKHFLFRDTTEAYGCLYIPVRAYKIKNSNLVLIYRMHCEYYEGLMENLSFIGIYDSIGNMIKLKHLKCLKDHYTKDSEIKENLIEISSRNIYYYFSLRAIENNNLIEIEKPCNEYRYFKWPRLTQKILTDSTVQTINEQEIFIWKKHLIRYRYDEYGLDSLAIINYVIDSNKLSEIELINYEKLNLTKKLENYWP